MTSLNSVISVGVLCLLGLTAYADESTEMEKMRYVLELFKVTGYGDLAQNGYSDCVSNTLLLAVDIEGTIRSALINGKIAIVETDFNYTVKRIEEDYKKYVDNVCKLTNPSNVVHILAKEYASHLTVEKTIAILEFYKSPIGQKEILASRKAFEDTYEELDKVNEGILRRASTALNEAVTEHLLNYVKRHRKLP